MNPIAQNHITITKDYYFEGMKAISNKKNIKLFRIIAAIILVIYACVNTFGAAQSGNINLFSVIGQFLIIIALILCICVYMPYSSRKSKYKMLCRQAGGEPQRRLEFFSSYLMVYADGGRNANISYRNIDRIKETQNLLVFHCTDGIVTFIDKNGFSSGDMTMVLEAIKNTKEQADFQSESSTPNQVYSKTTSIRNIASKSYIKEDEKEDE